MSAQIDFAAGRKPAQPKILALRQDEGGFRLAILERDALHRLGGQPVVPLQNTNTSRVAFKQLAGESVDLEIAKWSGHVREELDQNVLTVAKWT
jgi:hypothetical protein